MSTFVPDQKPPEAHDEVSEVTEVAGPDSFGGNEFEDDPSPAPAASSEDIPDDVAEPEAPATFTKPDNANVVLAGIRANEALPEGKANIGTYSVDIPSVGQQSVGFHVDPAVAGILVTQFTQYKFLVDKGQATPPVTT